MWTQEIAEYVLKNRKKSRRELSSDVLEKFNVTITRNAIGGFLWRARGKTEISCPNKKPGTRPKSEAPPPVVLQKEEVPKKAFKPKQKKIMSKQASKNLVDQFDKLTNFSCRWPIGDINNDDFHFCGKSKPLSQSYCDEHNEIMKRKSL